MYRYKLRRSKTLVASDGVAVLESLGSALTRFTEYGFFETDSSLVPASVIWRHAVKGEFLSAVAIKLRAEHPGWSYRQIANESERLALEADRRLEECVADRHQHRLAE